MRALILAAAAAFALFSAAGAAGPIASGSSLGMDRHFTMDATGKCHDEHGKLAAAAMCHPTDKRCHDPKTGHFTECAADAGGGMNTGRRQQ